MKKSYPLVETSSGSYHFLPPNHQALKTKIALPFL